MLVLLVVLLSFCQYLRFRFLLCGICVLVLSTYFVWFFVVLSFLLCVLCGCIGAVFCCIGVVGLRCIVRGNVFVVA